MLKSIQLAAAVFCLVTTALANSDTQLTQDMGGAYTNPHSAKVEGVPAALISEELLKVAPFAAPVVPMPEAPSAAVLAVDLLAVAGLVVVSRKNNLRSRALRA